VLTQPADPRRIAFPGPTAARKGAHDVREAAMQLGLEVVLTGSELEGGGFWAEVDTVHPAESWLDGVSAVVQPAVIEDQPRKLLAALATGVPVIATQACGLPAQPGLTLIAEGDAGALAAALSRTTTSAAVLEPA
jgi:glycosyltransferase involved in cell wall biosynthesis